MTPILHVKLLGPPEVYFGDELVSIPRRNPKALLFYLAFRNGMVSRDDLLDLLWPETAISPARLRLNENLSRLRASLPDPKLIISEGNLVGVDDLRVRVDARKFDQIVTQVGNLPWQIPDDQPLPDRFVQKLSDALALWSGSRFMAGDVLPSTPELDGWLVRTGSHYDHHRLNIIERLARHFYFIGDYYQAQRLAWNGIHIDQANPSLHLMIMQCLVNQGYLREARKHYFLAQESFKTEPGFDGSPEMDALYAQCDPDFDRKSTAIPQWKLHPSINVPFIGRQDVLGQLERCYRQYKSVGILGESGSGKTRLVQEFTHRIQPPPRVMVGVCKPYETSLPFQPIIDVLRRSIKPEEWLALPPVWAGHLLRLIPELSTLRPDLEIPTIPVNPVQAQATLLEAIRQVFLTISQAQQLVLVIDDNHWADEATLSTLVYLHSRPPFSQQSFLVVLARQEELSATLEEMVFSMDDNPQVVIIRLTGLSAQDISNLARYILKEEPSVNLVQNLLKGTGGNALFILEVLKEMLDLDTDPMTNLDIPLSENLLALIQARIQKIDPIPRDILEIAAILGPQFDARMIIQVSSEPDAVVVKALDHLEKNLILNPIEGYGHPDRYQFAHDKFREALVAMISPAKATVIHEQIADIIAVDYNPEKAAILAQHSQAAGKFLDAFHYWFEAGTHARSLLSKEEAQNAFSQAENLLPKIENELSVDDIYNFYTTWHSMAYETHQVHETDRLANQLLAIGEKLQHPLLTGTALDLIGTVAFMENKFSEGLDYTLRAIPYLEESGDVFRQMEAHNHCGVSLYMQRQINDAIRCFEKALALDVDPDASELDSPRAFTHFQLSLLQTLKGWPQNGMEHGEISLKAANRANRIYSRVSAYFVLTFSSYYLADFRQARNFARTGIGLAERGQLRRMLGYLNGYAGAVELTLGNPDLALKMALNTIQQGEETELSDVISMGCRHAGDVYTRLGALDAASKYYERGAMTGGKHFFGLDNSIHLGFVLCISGQLETGHQILANLRLATSKIFDLGLGVLMSEFFLSMVYAFEGEWEQAGHLAHKVKDTAHLQNIPTYYYDAILLIGDIAFHNGDLKQAIECFQMVAEDARSRGNLWSELSAQIQLMQVYTQTNNPNTDPAKRLDHLMSELEKNCQSDALREIFLAYKKSIYKFQTSP